MLVFSADASLSAVGRSMHVVDCPGCNELKYEMLKTPGMAILLATGHQKRSGSKARWPIWEAELSGQVENVKKHGGLINITILHWDACMEPANQIIATASKCSEQTPVNASAEMKRQLGGLTVPFNHSTMQKLDVNPPIAFVADAQTAIGKWNSFDLPGDVHNFLFAKSMRYYNWYEETAGMLYIPHKMKWESGEVILLPHMLSHLAD